MGASNADDKNDLRVQQLKLRNEQWFNVKEAFADQNSYQLRLGMTNILSKMMVGITAGHEGLEIEDFDHNLGVKLKLGNDEFGLWMRSVRFDGTIASSQMHIYSADTDSLTDHDEWYKVTVSYDISNSEGVLFADTLTDVYAENSA